MNHKNALIGLAIVIILLTPLSVITALLTYTVTLTSNGIISTSEMSTYYISKTGSNINVINGSSGAVLYTNTNANSAFSKAFQYVANGGTVVVEPGTYTASGTSILMQNCYNVKVIFQSGAILTISNGANVAVLKLKNCVNSQIINAQIDGNAANQNAYWYAHGIEIWGCTNCVVDRAKIDNCATYGFYTHADTTGIDDNNGITNSVLTNCQQNGITLGSNYEDTSTKVYAINNTVTDSSDVGITAYANGSRIIGNYVHDLWGLNNTKARWGIASEGASHCIIANNTIENCIVGIMFETDGNMLRKVSSNLVINNYILNCAPYGICDNSIGYNTITQNTVVNTRTTYLNNNLYAAIRIGQFAPMVALTNDIVSSNTIINTNATNGYIQSAIWQVGSSSYSMTDCSIVNNIITTVLGVRSTGIGIQTNCVNTKIEGNNIQAYRGVGIEDSTCTGTRVISNTLVNSTTQLFDGGTGTKTSLTGQQAVLTFNCIKIFGSTSLNAGTYYYTQGAQQTITLYPNSGYSALLHIDGSNVALTGDQYVITMSTDHSVYVFFE